MGFMQSVGRVTNRGQVWVPAAAVIPTLLVYSNVAAFKTFVVDGVYFAKNTWPKKEKTTKLHCSLGDELHGTFFLKRRDLCKEEEISLGFN